jgi:hypothetical protein
MLLIEYFKGEKVLVFYCSGSCWLFTELHTLYPKSFLLMKVPVNKMANEFPVLIICIIVENKCIGFLICAIAFNSKPIS